MLSGFLPMNVYADSDPNSALKKRANDRAIVTPALKVYQYNGIEEPCFGMLLYSHIPIISQATRATSREKDSSRVQQWAGRVISSRLSSSVCVLLLTCGFFRPGWNKSVGRKKFFKSRKPLKLRKCKRTASR
jgi:hypothetical protein